MSQTLSIRSPAIPVVGGVTALVPVRLSGQEGVNGLFHYELLLKTPDALNLGASGAADFDLDAFIGREIQCRIELDGSGAFLPGTVGASVDHVGAGVRVINALITEASLWGEEGRHVQYKLTLRPWLHLATLSTDCRIFQNQSVVQILDALLADYPFPVDKRLIESYPERDYQTQFNESDFDFFIRLCQEWGINYFFEHTEGKHRLVLVDAMGAYRPNPSEAYRAVEYHAPGWKTDAEYLHSVVPAPFGPKYLQWWKTQPGLTLAVHLLFPITIPVYLLWSLFNWLSYATEQRVAWPQKVLDTLGPVLTDDEVRAGKGGKLVA